MASLCPSASSRVTRYDANGNQTSRTLAADSPEAATEHYYYDAANRQVAIVNDARVLHQFGYDANGNQTSIKRYIDPISGSVTLASATLSTLLADITPNVTQDQETTFAYDALNRESRLTDLMGPGSADDITISSKYDAVGNLSLRTDPEGFVTQTAYDALGHITQTRSPDGNRSFIEYDAAGFKIKAWTGDLGSNQATAATNVTASIGNALSVGWEVAGNQLTSFLVYDTTAHDDPSGYANESGQQGSGAVSVDVALTGLSAGSVVFFRVVTVDAAGSRAWTDEFSVTVPVLLSNLSVAQAGSNLEITARFNGSRDRSRTAVRCRPSAQQHRRLRPAGRWQLQGDRHQSSAGRAGFVLPGALDGQRQHLSRLRPRPSKRRACIKRSTAPSSGPCRSPRKAMRKSCC